jgi:hypothetical protein
MPAVPQKHQQASHILRVYHTLSRAKNQQYSVNFYRFPLPVFCRFFPAARKRQKEKTVFTFPVLCASIVIGEEWEFWKNIHYFIELIRFFGFYPTVRFQLLPVKI